MPTKIYQRFKMPMMSTRECLLKLSLQHFTEGPHAGKSLWVMGTFEDPQFPIKKNVIRISMFKASMIWEENGNACLREFSTFNMGGYFPMRLMNMAIASMVRQNIEKDYQKLVNIQNGNDSTGTNTE